MHLVAAQSAGAARSVGAESAGAARYAARIMDSVSSCSSGSKPPYWADLHDEEAAANEKARHGSPRSGFSSSSSEASSNCNDQGACPELDMLEIARLKAEMLNQGLTEAERDQAKLALSMQRRNRHKTHKPGPPEGGSNMTQGIFADRNRIKKEKKERRQREKEAAPEAEAKRTVLMETRLHLEAQARIGAMAILQRQMKVMERGIGKGGKVQAKNSMAI